MSLVFFFLHPLLFSTPHTGSKILPFVGQNKEVWRNKTDSADNVKFGRRRTHGRLRSDRVLVPPECLNVHVDALWEAP